jgi:hypothetical protein
MTNPNIPNQVTTRKDIAPELPSLDDMERNLRQKPKVEIPHKEEQFPEPILSQNTFYSNFPPPSAIPFARTFSDYLVTAALPSKKVNYPFYQIPPKRFLLVNSFSCALYKKYMGIPVTLQAPRLNLFPVGDQETFPFSIGFNLLANQVNNTFLTAHNRGPLGSPAVSNDLFGYYYTYNQNVLVNGAQTPSFLMFGENQTLNATIAWEDFPTTADYPADPTYGTFKGFMPVFFVGGYLLNSVDYYRFLASASSVDLPQTKA